jgi:hypothetical protein
MKTLKPKTSIHRFTKLPLAIALGAVISGTAMAKETDLNTINLVSPAYAQQGQGNAGKGHGQAGKGSAGDVKGGRAGGAAGGSKSLEDSVLRGKSSVSAEDDDDSDRPDWAGGDKDLNPHRGEGNPNPGDMKGEDYGDLYVIIREFDTGEPFYVTLPDGSKAVVPIAFYDANPDPEVEELVYLTQVVDGQTTLVHMDLDAEGEIIPNQTFTLPDGTVVQKVAAEVDFGRANLVRAPDKVSQHALEEATSKILEATSVTLDPIDGRVIVDGAKIDSPLENLALYIALLDGKLSQEVLDKLPDTSLDLAATLLAAGGDKTRDIEFTLEAGWQIVPPDYVYYLNTVMDLDVDFSTYTYDRSDYNTTVNYLYFTDETQTATELGTVNLYDYLTWLNGPVTDTTAIEGFSLKLDDTIELIEFTHTQVHPYELTEENVAPQ